MKSLSECYVVHFISETRILYRCSETKVNARIENIFSYRASPGQTEVELGFVHSNGNVQHLSGFTGLMRQHAPHIRHLKFSAFISLVFDIWSSQTPRKNQEALKGVRLYRLYRR